MRAASVMQSSTGLSTGLKQTEKDEGGHVKLLIHLNQLFNTGSFFSEDPVFAYSSR